MAVMLGDYVGASAERDRQHRGRMDLMRAFEDFKASNPYATAADFQSFIDQSAGMENYLRGGMPGREVLSRLEQQNMERKRRDTVTANLAEMNERAKTMGQLEAMASQFLLNEDDPNQARQRFVESMGGPDRLTGIDFDHLFTPQNRERVYARQSAELLPTVLDLMEQTGGSASAAEISRQLGVNSGLADSLRNQAQRRYQQQQNERLVKNHGQFVDFIVTGARNGYDLTDMASRLAEQTGIEPAMLQPVVEQARVQVDRENRERRGQQIERAEARIGEDLVTQMVLNDPQRGRQILRERLEMYGDIDVDDELIDTLWRSYSSRHDAARRIQWEERRSALPGMMEDRLEENTELGRATVRNYTTEDSPLQRVLLELAGSHDITDPNAIMRLEREHGGKGEDPMELRQRIIDAEIFPTRDATRQSIQQNFEAVNPKPQSFSQWHRQSAAEIDESVADSATIVEEYAQMDPILRANNDLFKEKYDYTSDFYENTINNLRRAGRNSSSWLLSGEPFDERRTNQLIRHLETQRDRHLRALQEAYQSALEMVGQQQGTQTGQQGGQPRSGAEGSAPSRSTSAPSVRSIPGPTYGPSGNVMTPAEMQRAYEETIQRERAGNRRLIEREQGQALRRGREGAQQSSGQGPGGIPLRPGM